MALSNEEILEAIASKSVLEISELIKLMEEKFRIPAFLVPSPLVMLESLWTHLTPLLLALPPRPLKPSPSSTSFCPTLARTRSR